MGANGRDTGVERSYKVTCNSRKFRTFRLAEKEMPHSKMSCIAMAPEQNVTPGSVPRPKESVKYSVSSRRVTKVGFILTRRMGRKYLDHNFCAAYDAACNVLHINVSRLDVCGFGVFR